MKFVVLALSLAAFTAAASADVPPPPEPVSPVVDEAALAAAASALTGAEWGIEVTREGTRYAGDVKLQPGNRFALTIRQDGGAEAKTGTGIWGIVETASDESFTVLFAIIERGKRGGFEPDDDAIIFRLTPAGDGVLKGTLVDGDDIAPTTFTRR